MPRFTDARPPTGPDDRTSPTAIALGAVGRLLSAADEAALLEAVVAGARLCFDAAEAVVLLPVGGTEELRVATGPRQGHALQPPHHPLLAQLLARRIPFLTASRRDSRALNEDLTGRRGSGMTVLLRLADAEADGVDAVLVLTGLTPPPMDTLDTSVATGFADAAAAGLQRVRAAAEHARQAEQQRALTRAAKQLNGSLDLATVTARLVAEAVAILDADVCSVMRRTETGGARIDHAFGMPDSATGHELAPGVGVAGEVIATGRSFATSDYHGHTPQPAGSPLQRVRSCMGVPMRWDGAVQGVLIVGFLSQRDFSPAEIELLEAFGELAATAYGNAATHAGIVRAARTDGLTGCLNHAALHQALRSEMERTRRTGEPLSLVLLDLDHFKTLNDEHGHLAGDDALRRVALALRETMRPYDHAGRYGGDEFVLVTVGADEETAAAIASRALERVTHALGALVTPGGTAATAGVAQWHPRQGIGDFIAAADRALLWAKHHQKRGGAFPAGAVPEEFRPTRTSTRTPPTASAVSPELVDERLRKRTRGLALANALGTRLAAMTDRDEIAAAALDELIGAFGYFSASLCELRDGVAVPIALRGEPFAKPDSWNWTVPLTQGLIGRCLRDRRPVLVNDVHADPEWISAPETLEVNSELVVPVFCADELWGCLNFEELRPDAFDADDVSLLETVAAQVGAALRSAAYVDQLEHAYLGTAEALAGALEAKDAYTADHARQIADQAAAVAAAMDLDEDAVRDVRLAAILHDIGKIAVPEHILNKPGPLTDDEFEVVKRHTIVGEQILQPVEALAGVCPLVRHEHERFDGGGYPDGLRGDAIPLGSRIILACDALHAMTSDRPYRRAMSDVAARAELRRHAGTQFDPRVVETLLDLSAAESPAGLAG